MNFCVDANVFIESWKSIYRHNIFPSLWDKLVEHSENIHIIQPIWDEIDPISQSDKNLPDEKRHEKYPLRAYLTQSSLSSREINEDVQREALKLTKTYETKEISKGASKNDITLIAYAKAHNLAVVTLEAEQGGGGPRPRNKWGYKIPLICQDEDIEWIRPVEMFGQLEISI